MRTCVVALLSAVLGVLITLFGYTIYNAEGKIINWDTDIIETKIKSFFDIKPSFIYEGEYFKLTKDKIYIPLHKEGIKDNEEVGWLILDKDKSKKPQMEFTYWSFVDGEYPPVDYSAEVDAPFIILAPDVFNEYITNSYNKESSMPGVIAFVTLLENVTKIRIDALIPMTEENFSKYTKGHDLYMNSMLKDYKAGRIKTMPFADLYPGLDIKYSFTINHNKTKTTFFYEEHINEQFVNKFKEYFSENYDSEKGREYTSEYALKKLAKQHSEY